MCISPSQNSLLYWNVGKCSDLILPFNLCVSLWGDMWGQFGGGCDKAEGREGEKRRWGGGHGVVIYIVICISKIKVMGQETCSHHNELIHSSMDQLIVSLCLAWGRHLFLPHPPSCHPPIHVPINIYINIHANPCKSMQIHANPPIV